MTKVVLCRILNETVFSDLTSFFHGIWRGIGVRTQRKIPMHVTGLKRKGLLENTSHSSTKDTSICFFLRVPLILFNMSLQTIIVFFLIVNNVANQTFVDFDVVDFVDAVDTVDVVDVVDVVNV